tara:strand:- start:26432 stop:27409 length:978 start_codon:yes stop_codon:yes gene_type:complete
VAPLLKEIKSLPYLSKPSPEEFKKLRGKPMVFKDSIENEWANRLNFDTIKTLIPNIKVVLRRSLCNTSERIECDFHDYINYITERKSLQNCYTENQLTGESFFKEYHPSDKLYCLEMDSNYNPDLAKFFSCPSFMGDWFDKYMPLMKKSVLEGKRHTWFFIGPKGTLSELHTDHDSIHTTIQQCDGQKRFFTIMPKDQIELEDKHADEDIESLRFDLNEQRSAIEVTSVLKNSRIDSLLESLKGIDVFVNDLSRGDVIYIPCMTGHYAVSLSNSIGVSRDFVDELNLDKYLFSCLFSSHVFEVANRIAPYSLLQSLKNEYESLKI